MNRQLGRFVADETGGVLIEYAFLAALIALAAIGGMANVGSSLSSKLGEIDTALS